MFRIPFLAAKSGGSAARSNRRVSRQRPTARRLRHEPLEDRRLLSLSQLSIDDVTVTEGDDTPRFLDAFVDPGPGALKSPRGMTVGPDGYFYVASTADHRIARFDATSQYVDDFVPTGYGGVVSPVDVEFGPDGNAYVCSADSDAILRYSGTTGAFIDAFVAAGDGGLDRPSSVQFSGDGTLLYVASSHSDQILKYHGPNSATPGQFIEAFVSDDPATETIDESGGLDFPAMFHFHTDGYLYVGSYYGHEILRYDGTTGAFDGAFIPAGAAGDLTSPAEFSFRPDGNFYVANRGTDSIQKYDGNGTYIGEYVTPNSGDLYDPRDFIFHSDGMLYVASTGTQEVLQYDAADGSFVDEFVESRIGGLATARGLAIGPDGNYYVVSAGNRSVLRYDAATGEYLDAFVRDNPDTPAVDETGGLLDPVDLTFEGGFLYVTSGASNAVFRYDAATGAFDSFFVSSGDGGLARPSELVFHDGYLYVSSSNTNSVLRYDAATGAFDQIFIASDSGLNYPIGLAFDSAGNVYVANYKISSNILQFDANGSFVREFAPGEQNGLFDPVDLAISDGMLYVAAEGSDSVLRFDLATGAFIDAYAASSVGGLNAPRDLVFGADDNMYVVSRHTGEVLRYGAASQAVFTVNLTNPSETPVTVDYATANGSAEAGSDFVLTTGALAFAPGETSKTIIVPTIDDAVAEHNETFVVDLSNPIGATIAHGTGEALILDPTTHQSTDVPKDLKDAKNAARPGVTTSTIEVTDSGKVFDLNVELDITHTYDGQLTATLFSPDGTPVELFSNVGGSGDHFTATVLDDEAATSISAGSAPFTGAFQPEGSLAALNDLDAAGTWTLEISDNAKGDTGTLNSWSIEIATYLPPAVPGITVSETSLVTYEDQSQPAATFTVVLDSQPTAEVTIAVSSSNTDEGTVSPASLSFYATNWSTPQTVTVTGVDDTETDGDVGYTIITAPATGASEYAGIDPADVSVTNMDDDGQGNYFESQDVPKTIADPNKKGRPRPVTSGLTPTSSETVDTVTVDATIVHGEWDDLTVTLAHPDGGSVALSYLSGNQWQAVDSTAFQGQALDRTWTLTIVDGDRNGYTGTLTAWSITVTPLTGGAAASSQSAAAFDMALLAWADLDSSDDDNPLATQAADELALMMME